MPGVHSGLSVYVHVDRAVDVRCAVRRRSVELRCAGAELTIAHGALAKLIDSAQRARTELARRLALPQDAEEDEDDAKISW